MGTSVDTSGVKVYGPYEYSLGDELRGERATLGKTLLDVQRDLRIKAAYIAAIEDAKPEVFPNPSFISGYVRSYARHLGLDPDEVFHRFCLESGFRPGGQVPSGTRAQPVPGGFRPDFPLTRGPVGLPEIPVRAIGSLAVLGVLVAGLGYGGWLVLQNTQRVQFAPIEELPVAVAEIDALAAPAEAPAPEPALSDLAAPVSAVALADLYRQQELEVPIIEPRDGPIAALDPDATGLLAHYVPAVAPAADPGLAATPAVAEVPAGLIGPMPAPDGAAAAPLPVVVVAERAAWIRVYQDNGTVVFERILESGETYPVPEGLQAPLIWAGNSGSVYVRVGTSLRGPLGSGTRAAKDVALTPDALAERYSVVLDVPEVISQSTGVGAPQPSPAVAIQ